MKRGVSIFLCTIMAFAGAAMAQSAPDAKWLGVWQGELDGQPSAVLTLANDAGALGGTLVLNIIENKDGQARIVAVEPHVLLNPRSDGDVMAFQCRKPNGGVLSFSVKLVAANKATIHCLNCGPDAPTVEIVRAK